MFARHYRFLCTVSRKKRKCPPKRSPHEESPWEKRDGLRAGRLGEGNVFSEKFPFSRRSACLTPIRPKAATRTGRGAGRDARRGGLPGLFQAGRYRLQAGQGRPQAVRAGDRRGSPCATARPGWLLGGGA